MRRMLERTFARYGREVVLTSHGVQKTVKAFFQGSRSKSWQNMQRVYFPLGEIPRGQYLCYLLPGTAVAGDLLTVGGETYEVCRVEEMWALGQSMYQWCLCAGKGGEDTWGLPE